VRAVHEALLTLARTWPLPFALVVTASAKGRLPLSIARHWLARALVRDILWPHGRPWIGRVVRLPNGMRMEVDPFDYVGATITEHGYYEPETVAVVERLLRPGMVVFDVGAHMGQYTLVASGAVGPAGRVHAFEPQPRVRAALERNVRRNRLRNVVVVPSAVGETNRDVTLYLPTSFNYGAASLRPPGNYAKASLTVPMVSLDTHAFARSVPRVDLVKLDIEGGELAALHGAAGLLQRHRDVIVVVELAQAESRRFGHSTDSVAEFLSGLGFRLYIVTGAGLVPYQPLPGDAPDHNIVATRRPMDAV
jgi:FkbM family methyltransferase